jgi:hypothetical protein
MAGPTQIFSRKAQVVVKEEATEDTYLAPAGDGTGIMIAQNVNFSVDQTSFEPEYLRGDYLSGDVVPGSASATMSFDVPAKGSGDPGDVVIEYDSCLKACGLEATNSAGTSDTYTPISTFTGVSLLPGISYSASLLINGVRHAVGAAFANMTFAGNADGIGMFTFTFQGQYQAYADDALEAPTLQTTIPPAFRGASMAVNMAAAGSNTMTGVQNFTFDLGNVITVGKDVNNATGVYGARIVSRRSSGSIDPEIQLAATTSGDFFAAARAGTVATITTGAVGSTAGNKYQFDIARAVFGMPTSSNRGGIESLTVPFTCGSLATHVEGTNADVTLTYT